jgi:glycosyltransferase involved in cell wall biosynthesis
VPPHRPDALLEALADVVEDDRSLRALGACARARVEEKYDADKNTARLVELLGSVAG